MNSDESLDSAISPFLQILTIQYNKEQEKQYSSVEAKLTWSGNLGRTWITNQLIKS